MVNVGSISSELCGGTHVASAGEIGTFKIISESSVASGIRRIEAVTKGAAKNMLKEQKNQLQELAKIFKTSEGKLPDRVTELTLKIKQMNKRLDKSRINSFKARADKIIRNSGEASGIKIITQQVDGAQIQMLRTMSDLLRQRARRAVVVLASTSEEGRVLMICALTTEARSQGLDAVKIIRAVAGDVGGSGGGRADFAQAGGNNPRGINKALGKVEGIVKKELKG